MNTPTPAMISKNRRIFILDVILLATSAPRIDPIAPNVKMVA